MKAESSGGRKNDGPRCLDGGGRKRVIGQKQRLFVAHDELFLANAELFHLETQVGLGEMEHLGGA